MVSQIERGEIGDPRGTTVQALADALTVDAGWLLAGLGEPPVAAAAEPSTQVA